MRCTCCPVCLTAARVRACHATWCAAAGSRPRRVRTTAVTAVCRACSCSTARRPTDTVAELEQALRQAVAQVRDELIDPAELKRVVTQAVANKVYEADSLFNQATEIGMLETIGLDWRLSTTEIDSLKAVTPEQVRTVAQRYLVDDNLTVATLVPLPMDQQQPGQPAVPEAVMAVKHGWVCWCCCWPAAWCRRAFGRVLAHQPRCQGDVRACTRTADGRCAGRRRRRQCARWAGCPGCRDSPMRCSARGGRMGCRRNGAAPRRSAGSSSAAVRCATWPGSACAA